MKKTIKINGVDFSRLFTPYGYTVQYKKVRGPNSGDMLSGEHTDDVRAWKAVVQCVCVPSSEAELARLLTICEDTYVSVYYFDIKTNAYRTAIMMPSEPTQKHAGMGANGVNYWSGTAITFTEK